MLVQVTREVHNLGVELVSGEGLTYHTRENRDTYFWYAWDASHALEAKKPCFSYPNITERHYLQGCGQKAKGKLYPRDICEQE